MDLSLFPQPDPQRLRNIYWLGGSPCSGKSSMSDILAAQFNLVVYHVDEAFDRHVGRFDPSRYPAMCSWLGMDWEARWMRPEEVLLEEVIACYSEHFSLVLADLLSADLLSVDLLSADLQAMEINQPMLVEGSALVPDLVHPWLTDADRRRLADDLVGIGSIAVAAVDLPGEGAIEVDLELREGGHLGER